MSAKKTLFDKVWDSHVVQRIENGPDVLFIDRHMANYQPTLASGRPAFGPSVKNVGRKLQ